MQTLRSLKNGIDVRTTGDVIIRSVDTMTIQSAEVDVTTVGRLTIVSTVIVEK